MEVPNSVSSVAPGVDVRGAGGYVQGPGTVNATGTYWWDQRCLSPLGKLAEMPASLLRHCMGASREDEYSTCWKRSPIRKELLDPVVDVRDGIRIGYLIRKLDVDLAWDAAQQQ